MPLLQSFVVRCVIPFTVVAMLGIYDGFAQVNKDALVGTWKLISYKDTTEDGKVKDSFGKNPTGFLTYTADGRMMAIITADGQKPLSTRDFVAAPSEEKAEAFASVIAYGGRYTVMGDRVIHHVEVSWIQNIVNTDQIRFVVKLDGNQLVLRTAASTMGGIPLAKQELVWERVK